MKNGVKIDYKVFVRVYNLQKTSMEIKYKNPGVMDVDVVLVKSKNPLMEDEDSCLGWEPYFRKIKIIESDANHFNIIKTHYAKQWIKLL